MDRRSFFPSLIPDKSAYYIEDEGRTGEMEYDWLGFVRDRPSCHLNHVHEIEKQEKEEKGKAACYQEKLHY